MPPFRPFNPADLAPTTRAFGESLASIEHRDSAFIQGDDENLLMAAERFHSGGAFPPRRKEDFTPKLKEWSTSDAAIYQQH
jgi:hypothetical protein